MQRDENCLVDQAFVVSVYSDVDEFISLDCIGELIGCRVERFV